MEIVLQLTILLFSVMLHEISHGSVANLLGDPTAKNAGRLTLNPLKHLDPLGSFIVPFILYFTTAGSFVFGWAKPVPFNPFLLKNPKKDSALIALAGPLSNISLALFFGLFLRIGLTQGLFLTLPVFVSVLQYIVLINLFLAFFNALPVPPLDGSKIFFGFLPDRFAPFFYFLERNYLLVLFLVILFGFRLIESLVFFIFRLIAGGL